MAAFQYSHQKKSPFGGVKFDFGKMKQDLEKGFIFGYICSVENRLLYRGANNLRMPHRHRKPRCGRICSAPGLSLPPLRRRYPRRVKRMTLQLLFKIPASPFQRLFFLTRRAIASWAQNSKLDEKPSQILVHLRRTAQKASKLKPCCQVCPKRLNFPLFPGIASFKIPSF